MEHGNAESAYVTDPDGHTVQVTWHRPREQWDAASADPGAEDILYAWIDDVVAGRP